MNNTSATSLQHSAENKVERLLQAAWTSLAPGRVPGPFPRGFWPDLARVAVEMALQDTLSPVLDFRPTLCNRGNYPLPEPASPRTGGRKNAGKISEAAKKANTLALLAKLKGNSNGI